MTYYLGEYHSYRLPNSNEINPEFHNHKCGLILDLKTLDYKGEQAVEHFLKEINSRVTIPNDFTIVIVPSSDKDNTETGVKELAQRLAKNGRIDGTSCLVRHTSIPKSSKGGPRNIGVHLNSIKVVNEQLIKGKRILLIDDVTTSGSSLNACEMLLKQAGAVQVEKLALAKTM